MLENAICRIRAMIGLFHSRPLRSQWAKISMGPRSCLYASPDSKVIIGRLRLADNVRISVVDGTLSIGEDVFLNRNCTVVCKKEISIGSGCLFGPGVSVYDHNHLFSSDAGVDPCRYSCKPVSIGDNCWIGSNVTILAGAAIGDGCVVSAGSVVKGIIPDHSLVGMTSKVSVREIEDR